MYAKDGKVVKEGTVRVCSVTGCEYFSRLSAFLLPFHWLRSRRLESQCEISREIGMAQQCNKCVWNIVLTT